MKDLDFNKIKIGIRLPMAIGAVLIIVEYILLSIITLGLPFVIRQFNLGVNVAGFIGVVNLIIVLLFFTPLFLWTGHRMAKRYGSDLLEAGVTAAIIAVILVVLEFMLNTFLYLVATIADITTLHILLTKISLEGIVTAAIGVPAAGIGAQLIVGTFCCLGRLFLSGAVNFLVGGIGGYFGGGERKSP